jgi:hypothetical protein
MRARSASIFPVEGQSTPQAESVKSLTFVQLRIDPLGEIEETDRVIRSRQRGSRPGLTRLLTQRRDAMRALAAELLPESVVLPLL